VQSAVEQQLTATCSPEERKRVLSLMMDELSEAFSILTGSACRCCVKVLEPLTGRDGEQLEVRTLCRNTKYVGEDKKHPVAFNTDFKDLYQNRNKQWFFGNNLPEMARNQDYRNTTDNWKARYRSCLTWPIRRPELPAGGDSAQPDFLGFLCVDSRRTKPFSEGYDYPLGATVAHALYPLLLKIAAAESSTSATHAPHQTPTAAPHAATACEHSAEPAPPGEQARGSHVEQTSDPAANKTRRRRDSGS
jgi:hypothetical protein